MNHTVDGVTLHYEIVGNGPPLLLLHGWGCCIATVESIARAVGDLRRVLSVDFPGFGDSDAPPEPWSVTEYTNCLLGLLKALDWPPTDIIAHSFGGRVTLLLAAEHPERVKKIVLTGGAGLIPRRGPRYYLKVWGYKLGKWIFGIYWVAALLQAAGVDISRRTASAGSEDYRALSGVMRATFVRVVNQNLRPCLPRIRSATLLVWGERDDQTPLWMAKVMEQEIPDAGLVVLDAGHYAFLDQPARFATIVRAFLTGA